MISRHSTYGPALIVEASKASLFWMKCGVQKGPLQQVSLHGTDLERTQAIAGMVSPSGGGTGPEFLPTCASGLKNQGRTGNVEMPFLCPEVFDLTSTHLEPIFDIESCIAWGHLMSLRGCINRHSPATLILTGGNEIYQSMWSGDEVVNVEDMALKKSPFGSTLIEPLKNQEHLIDIIMAHCRGSKVARVVLAGSFADDRTFGISEVQAITGTVVELASLPEAAAIGVRVLAALSNGFSAPRAL